MKLFASFSAPGFHTSIVTTFGIDFDAYEAVVLPRLRDAGCCNNVLVADARMLVQALGDDAHRPKFAGRRYSVVGAHSTGVFHPKLVLQLGKVSGRLLVASANMTSSGLAGNLEVVAEVTVTEGSTETAPVLRAALDYLLQHLEPTSVPRRQVEWALKRARWLPPAGSSDAVVELPGGERLAFLSDSRDTGIGERFVALIGSRRVKRLVVVSPYWDHDLRTLRRLREELRPERTAGAIQRQSSLFPVHALRSSDSIQLFDLDRAQGASATRFAHAKVIVAESDGGDCLLFGSANCTEAALGGRGQPGNNAEAALFRDVAAGEGVRLLGLEPALAADAELSTADVPSFSPTDDIPLDDLSARLPGRFELVGDILRWWPTAALSPESAVVELYDQASQPLVSQSARLGSHSSPVSFRLIGTSAPHFARVRAGAFESSFAVVVVEQAIQQSQRRVAGRNVENALDLLDDDDPLEGLWMLEVIQTIADAEHEMRAPRGKVEELPQQGGGQDQASESRVLSYEEFVAGRSAVVGGAETGSSLLAATHHESVRRFLNALIGKQAAYDLSNEAEEESQVPDLGTGDETVDGGAAVESGDQLQASVGLADADQAAKESSQLRERQQYVQDTQQSIVAAVGAFLDGSRRRATEHSLGVVDLLRLRALLAVVLGAGSFKTDLLPRDLEEPVRRRQVLPSSGQSGWPHLVGRLLFEFFRSHGGSRAPLIQKLQLEGDRDQELPEDILECWATCYWALCATRVTVNDRGASASPGNRENALALDLYRSTRLLPEQALGDAVGAVFRGMGTRYGARLGAAPSAVDREHRAMVETARLRAGA